jgi:hypothetical protein
VNVSPRRYVRASGQAAESPARARARQLLPWCVSACALVYVFGYKIDWHAIPAVTARANMPLFIVYTVLDKVVFFLVWGLLQAAVIRHFIEPVPVHKVMSVKGGAELLRLGGNSVADAGFLFGVSQLVRSAGIGKVVAISSIPFIAHFAVLLMQVTISLPLLEGGLASNRDVTVAVVIAWLAVALGSIGIRAGYLRRLLHRVELGTWIDDFRPRELLPYVLCFALFAVFDVFVQGMASRAFGVEIDWLALMARIPILYVALMIPSLGNFGTREIAWANLFADYGPHEALYAFALWTNTVFLAMHVIIGTLFFSRAVRLVREMREARRMHEELPKPILHDAVDP